MSKTNKELASEIVNNYVTAWFNYTGASVDVLQPDDVIRLLKDVYSALSSFEEYGMCFIFSFS